MTFATYFEAACGITLGIVTGLSAGVLVALLCLMFLPLEPR